MVQSTNIWYNLAMDFFDTLNEQQQLAVRETDGAVLVIAGAGSGKTRVLTYRIAYLIEEKHVDPYNILAITFTNKATNEMRERLEQLTGYSSSRLWVSTFHSFCAKVLRIDISRLEGYTEKFTIYGEPEKERTLKRILSACNLDKELLNSMGWHISNAKNHGFSPSQYENECCDKDVDTVIKVYTAYEWELRNSNALDYDDLLLKTKQLFLLFPEVLEKYAQRFEYIHVDEYQDTNRIQYELIRMLAGYHGNVFAVGDEDQCIYGWRGASIENILNFRKDFSYAKVIKLERNYRSSESILKAANALIKNNHNRMDKTLWSGLGEGQKIAFYTSSTDREESEYVIRCIHRLINDEGYSPRDIAILVRINALTNNFEENLRVYDIPYRVFGGVKFFDRKEVKDYVAYLRVLINPRDNEAMLRIINTPKRGIGDSVVEALVNHCNATQKSIADVLFESEGMATFSTAVQRKLSVFRDLICDLMGGTAGSSLTDTAEFVMQKVNFETIYDRSTEEGLNRMLNIEEVIQSISEFAENNPDAGLSNYLESVSLVSDTDEIATEDYVSVATVHAVKGLEFKAVFVVGLEEGIFPNAAQKTPAEIEEERRVMYVAVTRARERLFLTNSQSRYRFARFERNMPSRFLMEIKKALGIANLNQTVKPWETVQRKTVAAPSQAAIPQLPSMPYVKPQVQLRKDSSGFNTGDKIEHTKFGVGMIVAMDGDTASIAFEGWGIKKFNILMAPIKKL